MNRDERHRLAWRAVHAARKAVRNGGIPLTAERAYREILAMEPITGLSPSSSAARIAKLRELGEL